MMETKEYSLNIKNNIKRIFVTQLRLVLNVFTQITVYTV